MHENALTNRRASFSNPLPGHEQLIVDVDIEAALQLIHEAQADMLPLGQGNQEWGHQVPLPHGFQPQLT